MDRKPFEPLTIPTPLTLEQFITVNEQELNCIFAESGADREYDFDRESDECDLYESPAQYPQLITTLEQCDSSSLALIEPSISQYQ